MLRERVGDDPLRALLQSFPVGRRARNRGVGGECGGACSGYEGAKDRPEGLGGCSEHELVVLFGNDGLAHLRGRTRRELRGAKRESIKGREKRNKQSVRAAQRR